MNLSNERSWPKQQFELVSIKLKHSFVDRNID